jgi:ABC-type transporter Mla MlaB component
MLRITDVIDGSLEGRATWTLKVEGTLNNGWVLELRRAWRRAQEAAPGMSVRVYLADVRFVDAAGKVLLAEMHRAGVEIVAHDCLTAAIRDDIVRAAATDRPARGATPGR